MPVTKSAKKKQRQDEKRQEQNALVKKRLKDTLKKARKNPSQEIIRLATQIADKAAKRHIIHSNKAARIKSTLAKLLPQTETSSPKPVRKTQKKSAAA